MTTEDAPGRPPDGSRCPWAESSEAMRRYHDGEWGVPSHDDGYLFEMLVLEGAQAGLSWSTIVAKRENYRQAMDGFDAGRVAGYDEDKVSELLDDPGIVRNRLKVRGAVTNARAFLSVRDEHGSFAGYLWAWVDHAPIVNHPRSPAEVPTRTELSDRVSRDLKRRGFTFVGSTIVHSYLEAVGLVDDHLVTCPFKPSGPGGPGAYRGITVAPGAYRGITVAPVDESSRRPST